MNVVGDFRWSNFTLDKYRYVLFTRPDTARGFINSFVLAFGAATLAAAAGTALAYVKGHPHLKTQPPAGRVRQPPVRGARYDPRPWPDPPVEPAARPDRHALDSAHRLLRQGPLARRPVGHNRGAADRRHARGSRAGIRCGIHDDVPHDLVSAAEAGDRGGVVPRVHAGLRRADDVDPAGGSRHRNRRARCCSPCRSTPIRPRPASSPF